MYWQFQMTASDYIFHQLINNNQLLYLTTSQQQHSFNRQLTHSSGDMLPLQFLKSTSAYCAFQQVSPHEIL